MQFYKRPGSKYWWFKFVYRNVRYQESTKQTNRRKAEDIAAAFRLRLIEGELDIKRKQIAPAFNAAMAEFLEWSKEHHAAHPNTTIRYTVASKPLLKFFGTALLDSITPEDVERYKSTRAKQAKAPAGKKRKKPLKEGAVLKAKKLKPATINRELACLKAMFNHFIKLDVVVKNPVSRVKLLAENNEQMRVLGFDEEHLYLAACSQPLHDIAVLMLETGMRPDEVYRITKENVHLDKGYVFNPWGKTKAARRKLPLSKRAAEVLRARIEATEGGNLFPHENDPEKTMLKANNAHYGALRRSGLGHFRLYDLRHTFASRAAMSGVDLVTLAALLGHSRIQMVMRYAHPTESHQVEAMKKLESFSMARQMGSAGLSTSALVN